MRRGEARTSDDMGSWHKLLTVACVTIVLSAGQTARADPVSDIKSYVAAVDGGDWNGASAVAGQLLEYPPHEHD
jgi:hypothetical protein